MSDLDDKYLHDYAGNCESALVVLTCPQCGRGTFRCVVCHLHDEPRGECSVCPPCAGCGQIRVAAFDADAASYVASYAEPSPYFIYGLDGSDVFVVPVDHPCRCGKAPATHTVVLDARNNGTTHAMFCGCEGCCNEFAERLCDSLPPPSNEEEP
jgi:hypothetical protein